MNKKLIAALIAITISIPTTASAALKSSTLETPTHAVLDTALDTTLAQFKGKIAQEVCILEWKTCPNGDYFMEGPGAATISPYAMTKNGFDHGTQMVSAALSANPNMKIVFIRIAGQNINYDRQISTELTIVNALKWVALNKDKYNIQAVSMSQGHHNLPSGPNYCPQTQDTRDMVNALIGFGIPTFMASGNNRDYTRIDWPSCLPEVISVGAGSRNGIEIYSNHDPLLLDYIAEGRASVYTPGEILKNATGTSIATQAAGASWIAIKQAKPSLSYQQVIDLLNKTSKPIKGKQGNGKLINLKEALVG
jgi:hypothetical protein